MTTSVVEWLDTNVVQENEYLFGGNGQCLYPSDVASIPTHPHLVVITMEDIHQVRVYDMCTKEFLCTRGTDDGCLHGEFGYPSSVVVTQDASHVIVADSYKGCLIVLSLEIQEGTTSPDVTLTWLHVFGKEVLKHPYGLALRTVNDRVTVLVAEWWGHRVSEWNMDGTRVRTVCGTGQIGSDEEQLTHPSDVVVLPQLGHIVVADIKIADSNYNRICVFRECGRFLYSFAESTLFHPCALAVDAQDHIIVLDHQKDIHVYDSQGAHMCTHDDLYLLKGPKGMEWIGGEGGRLYIVHSEEDRIDVFTPPLPVEPIAQQLFAVSDAPECVVCFDKHTDSYLEPCHHLCMCYECASSVMQSSGTCPICRSTIQGVHLSDELFQSLHVS